MTIEVLPIPSSLAFRVQRAQVLRDTPQYVLWQGEWGSERLPCLAKCFRIDRADPSTSTRLHDESLALERLTGIEGVAQLLHTDIEAGVLIHTIATGHWLNELPDWRHDVASALDIASKVTAILQRIHQTRVTLNNLLPTSIRFNPATGDVTLAEIESAQILDQVDSSAAPAGASGALTPFSGPESTGRMPRTADYRADFYCLGALIYWLINGQPPFEETDPLPLLHALLTKPPRPFARAVPPAVAAVISKLLSKNPEQRYQSAEGIRADLEYCLRLVRGGDIPAGFVPGRSDPRVRPADPSRLFGREAELGRLHAAMGKGNDIPAFAIVTGDAGVGKTALVRSLEPAVVDIGGIFISGKFDQFRWRIPFSAIIEALGALADHCVTDSPEQLAELRHKLRSDLGSDADFLVLMVPEFEQLLGPVRAPARGDTSIGSERTRRRLGSCLNRVFRIFSECNVAIVLFVDDLQWADPDSLEIFKMLATTRAGAPALVVGAYRDAEIGDDHPLARVVSQLRHARPDLIELGLSELDQITVGLLAADMLDTPVDSIEALARGLHQKTRGNTLFVLEYMRRIFKQGELERKAGVWTWDSNAVDRLPSSDKLVAGLLEEFRSMPAAMQALVGACACLGPECDVELLASVMQASTEEILALLRPLADRNILCVSSSIAGSTNRGGRINFSHDRMQQVAHALFSDLEKQQCHLRYARALCARRGAAASADTAAADHYLAAGALVEDNDERESVCTLLIDAAQVALPRGAHVQALRYAESAHALTGPQDHDTTRCFQIDLIRHAANFGLARYDLCNSDFGRLQFPSATSKADFADVVARQAWALMHQLRFSEAIQLLIGWAADLGIAHPPANGWGAALETEIEAVYAALDAGGDHLFAGIEPIANRELEEAVHLLIGASHMGAQSDPQLVDWIRTRLLRLGYEAGAFARLPLVLASAARPFIAMRGDYATGHRLSQIGMAALEVDPNPDPDLAGGIYYHLGLRSHFHEPLERCLQYIHRGHQLGAQSGDMHYASLACDSAPSIALACERELASARQMVELKWETARKIKHTAGMRKCEAHLLFIRALEGPDEHDLEGQPDQADLGEIARSGPGRLPEHAWSHRYVLVYAALKAAIFGQWPRALELARATRETDNYFDGLYVAVVQRFVLALALCQAALISTGDLRESLLRELDPLGRWLEQRARDAPANFAHMRDLVHAMQAWGDREFIAANAAFERSIEASARTRPYHHALACELAAQCYQAQGLARAAAAYRDLAIEAYRDWGALTKVDQMLAREAAQRPGTAHSVPRSSVPIDLQTVLQVGQILGQERDPDEVLRLLLQQVQQFAAAERGVLFWLERSDGRDCWTARAGFDPRGHWTQAAPSSSSDQRKEAALAELPQTAINSLRQSMKPLVLHDVRGDARFGRDPLVQRLGIKSIVGLPIRHRGDVVGILYLENRQTHTTLDAAQLETLRLIDLQFAIAYENAQLSRTLEQQVHARTEELRLENIERRRAEQDAQSANRAKSDFLANMSHEIRTPIYAISGLSELVLRGDLQGRNRDYIQKVSSAAELLTAIVDDILDFSKIESGKLDLEMREFALSEVIGGVVDMLDLTAHSKGLALSVRLRPEVPARVIGDPLRLGQVLRNLVANAVKFTHTGSVDIAVEVLDSRDGAATLRFSVRDTGIGLSQSDLSRLFEPFNQADVSTSRRFGGTGLGLAICRRLVELMGGEIEATGKPGQGATFRFTSPFSIVAEHSQAPEIPLERPDTTAPDRQRLRDLRVLLVDDNQINQEICASTLKRHGATVALANHGIEALARLSREPFDCVLMDCQMPEMDGYEATRKIRNNPLCQELPVIAVSAGAMAEDRTRAMAAGMNDHLSKPLREQALLQALLKYTKRSDVTAAAAPAVLRPPAEAYAQWLDGLRGIDVRAAQQNLSGATALLPKLLETFCEEHSDFGRHFEAALAGRDIKSARRLAHNLQSSARYLGCAQVHHAARQLELGCQEDGSSPDKLARELVDVLGQLEPVIASIRGLPVR